jgi:malonyl-CoA O-methyltransferase
VINFFKRIKRLTPLEGYNKWAETYHIEDNPIKRLSNEFIKNELPDLKGKAVLDAGCGTGRFCEIAIAQDAAFVKGIDLSPKMIAEAKKNCPRGEFDTGDLSIKAINEKYDVVICGLVLGHINSLESALTNLVSSLKPNGHLILTDFHPFQTMNNAKRTFFHYGKTFEVKHTLHPLGKYFELLKKSDINIISLKEPEFNNTPVIFGIHGVVG